MKRKRKGAWRLNYTALYLGVLAGGYAFMPFLVSAEYSLRGYLAFGGEWLAPLVIIALIELVRQTITTYRREHK